MEFSSLTAADWAQLEAYAAGTQAPADRAATEARLATDTTFSGALQAHRVLVAGIQLNARATLRQRLRRLENEIRAVGSSPATAAAAPTTSELPTARPALRVSWATRWVRLSAAAVLVLAGGAGTWALLRFNDPQRLADAYGAHDPGLPVLMGDTGPNKHALVQQAMNAYKLGDAATALATWDAVPPGTLGADTMLYYQGIFQLRLHQNSAAESAMAKLRTLPVTAFRERADYYFALALWAQGRTDEARKAFEQLANAPSHSFGAEAQTALDHLR